MNTLDFNVPGLPKPQPRPRWSGKMRRMYTPDTAKRWREAVAWAALGARNFSGTREPFAGGVELSLAFTMPDHRKADIDNLVKSTLDALVEAGVMRDDNQVVELHATKAVGKDTGCLVRLTARRAA